MSTSTETPQEPYVPGLSGQLANRAHYRGDVSRAVMTRVEPFGPDLFGALYSPVDATYDATTDLTTVQFQPIPRSNRRPGEVMPEELPPLTRQQRRQVEREQRKMLGRKVKR